MHAKTKYVIKYQPVYKVSPLFDISNNFSEDETKSLSLNFEEI